MFVSIFLRVDIIKILFKTGKALRYVQAFMIVKKVLIEDSKEPLNHIYYYIMYRLLKPGLKLLTRNLV